MLQINNSRILCLMATPQVPHMRPRLLASALTTLLYLAAPGFAQDASAPDSGTLVEISAQEADEVDDVVRLPGQGHVKVGDPHARHAASRQQNSKPDRLPPLPSPMPIRTDG
jgi:hypothetical protein